MGIPYLFRTCNAPRTPMLRNEACGRFKYVRGSPAARGYTRLLLSFIVVLRLDRPS